MSSGRQGHDRPSKVSGSYPGRDSTQPKRGVPVPGILLSIPSPAALMTDTVTTVPSPRGPLAGIRIVEFAGIGPGPLAGMLLADLGADVVVVDRPRPGAISALVPKRFLVTNRGKRLTTADLKSDAGLGDVMALLERADGLLEGFRPGTMERLGLGPEAVLGRRPSLVFCRITGWGQEGGRALTAGHDINYIAVTGALAALGRAGEPPTPPVNLLGDYAGGTMFAVTGMLAALLEAARTGRGQVVDAAMADGVGALLAPMIGMLAAGVWKPHRGTNLFDTGAPFYDVYRTRDDRFLAIGALEDEFFAELARGLGLTADEVARRWDQATWPALRERIGAIVATRSRDEWMAVFGGGDACVAPVLEMSEASADPENRGRGAFEMVAGVPQPAPAPRFSRTPQRPPAPPPETTTAIAEIVREWSSR